MHFAAWLSVGDSVSDPAGYYRNNVVGALSVLEAMVGRRRDATSCSRRRARSSARPIETPITEDLPKQPINAYGETKLAIEHALPHYEKAYGLRSIALRYFNAAGADPDGELGEDHAPEIHVIPRAIDAALGRDSFKVFGDDYSDAGRHLPARLRARQRSGVGAPARARRAARRGPVERLQPRQRPADVGARRHRRRSSA